MSKVLQERGFGSLPSSMKINPKDQVKSISTATADLSEICCMETSPYVVSEAYEVKILDAIDHNLPQKEKDPGSFTLPCFINSVCFDKAIVNLGASVSVMPFSTYTNLDLGVLSYTRLTIELADRTIKQPRGIAENVLDLAENEIDLMNLLGTNESLNQNASDRCLKIYPVDMKCLGKIQNLYKFIYGISLTLLVAQSEGPGDGALIEYPGGTTSPFLSIP
ncbi:hypothetical protein Tco_0778959 [Tanacetum coccineum]